VCNPSRTALLTTDNWGTVSPNYLKELLASHPLGDLLHMAKSPFGYPNGIRKAERERALLEHGAATHEEAKELLQKRYFGFEKGDPTIPLFSFVGRITSQKGVHLILNAVEELIQHVRALSRRRGGGPRGIPRPLAPTLTRFCAVALARPTDARQSPDSGRRARRPVGRVFGGMRPPCARPAPSLSVVVLGGSGWLLHGRPAREFGIGLWDDGLFCGGRPPPGSANPCCAASLPVLLN
jgi:hypothetical protein